MPIAAQATIARLVPCETGSCLLVRGHRASAQTAIRINARPVEVKGHRSWEVRLPMATIEDWSAPFARTLEITVLEPDGSPGPSETVRLPAGLLGHNLELASLVVHAR